MTMAQNVPSILLIDNDTVRKNHFSSRLRVTADAEVELGLNGFHAVHLLEKKHYNLILVFEELNDMPISEFISLIRINHSQVQLPIIYLAQQIEHSTKQELLGLGVNEVVLINKNFNFNHLVKLARNYLGPSH